MPDGRLTPKQQRFVEEYLVDLNATAAYKRAEYAARNDNVAAAGASTLLRNPKIAAAVAAAQQERSQRVGVTADKVIKGLLTEAERVGRGSMHAARVSAWTQLGKHLGMFVDRTRHEGEVIIQNLVGVTREDILGSRDAGHARNGQSAL